MTPYTNELPWEGRGSKKRFQTRVYMDLSTHDLDSRM